MMLQVWQIKGARILNLLSILVYIAKQGTSRLLMV